MLMVLDHLLVVVAPHSIVRLTLTRLSLPLFMFVAGSIVVRKGNVSRRRWFQTAALGVGMTLVLPRLWPEFPSPDVLLVIAIALAPFVVVQARPFTPHSVWWVVGGLVQALYLPIGWSGYEPGLVLAWFSLGVIIGRGEDLPELGYRLPWVLSFIGRRPLSIYCVHLLVLGGLVWWLS